MHVAHFFYWFPRKLRLPPASLQVERLHWPCSVSLTLSKTSLSLLQLTDNVSLAHFDDLENTGTVDMLCGLSYVYTMQYCSVQFGTAHLGTECSLQVLFFIGDPHYYLLCGVA